VEPSLWLIESRKKSAPFSLSLSPSPSPSPSPSLSLSFLLFLSLSLSLFGNYCCDFIYLMSLILISLLKFFSLLICLSLFSSSAIVHESRRTLSLGYIYFHTIFYFNPVDRSTIISDIHPTSSAIFQR